MTEIRIESTQIGKVSCLIFSGEFREPAPLIFFVHGYESDKRQGIPMGYELAKKGFICVSIDTILRGGRVDQEFDLTAGPEFQSVYPVDTELDGFITMFKMIRQTGLDIQALIDYFRDDSRIDVDKVGLVGYSMGGYAAFHTVKAVPGIKASVSIAGNPYFEKRWQDLVLECSTYPEWVNKLQKVERETAQRSAFIQEMDPCLQLVEDFPVPLLMICGDLDTVSPKKYLLDLYQQIREAHQPGPEDLKLSVYDGIDHQLTLAMAEETTDWLGKVFNVEE